jgi:FtsP/CotA-like multicopper oxidase with cupredoxin domain
MDATKSSPVLARRGFLGVGALGAGMLFAGAMPVLGRMPVSAQPTAGGPETTSRYPLYVPPALTTAALTAAAATVNFGPASSSVLAYNGSLPGPTVRARRGEAVSIALTNRLTEPTTIHWHGMVVPTSADGHPKDAVAPGGGYTYAFPIVQRACLNWYHPHPHMLTAKQVAFGLAGAFIVNDAEEDALGLPGGSRELPLVIRDADFDRNGTLLYKPTSTGYEGKVPLVNGTREPYVNVQTAVYRLRVLNGANGRVFRLGLGNGAAFTLIGNDGGLLEAATPVGSIEFGNGERLDLLIDFRSVPVGGSVMLTDLNTGWNLLEFRVTAAVTDPYTLPTGLSTITRLTNPVRTREFSFDGMGKINGKEYALNRIDFQVPFGQVERWRFKTGGNAPHPVHVHGASFQVQSRTGGRGNMVFPWEAGWKDTVLLQDRETVEVLVRFDGYRGLYLMHCHKLEHEEAGMMANFEVI